MFSLDLIFELPKDPLWGKMGKVKQSLERVNWDSTAFPMSMQSEKVEGCSKGVENEVTMGCST